MTDFEFWLCQGLWAVLPLLTLWWALGKQRPDFEAAITAPPLDPWEFFWRITFWPYYIRRYRIEQVTRALTGEPDWMDIAEVELAIKRLDQMIAAASSTKAIRK